MNANDIREFNLCLAACTDAQVLGVLEKERTAGRLAYVELVLIEINHRRISQ